MYSSRNKSQFLPPNLPITILLILHLVSTSAVTTELKNNEITKKPWIIQGSEFLNHGFYQ